MPAPLSKPPRFVWPPVEAGQVWQPPALPPPTTLAKLRTRLAPYVQAFERDWLGVLEGSWQRRAQEANWVADALGDYCPHCGASWESAVGLCAACDAQPVPWQRCVRLGSYDGVLRLAILECKHASGRALGEQLGAQLGLALLAALQRSQIAPKDALLVPIPMSWFRWLSRGRDHTLALCRGIRRSTGIEILPLLRRAHRPLQTGTTLDVRKLNVRNSMRVRRGQLAELHSRAAPPQVMILVDDVLTSGATMREAMRALQAGGLDFSDMLGGMLTARDGKESARPQAWAAIAAVTASPKRSSGEGKEGGRKPD